LRASPTSDRGRDLAGAAEHREVTLSLAPHTTSAGTWSARRPSRVKPAIPFCAIPSSARRASFARKGSVQRRISALSIVGWFGPYAFSTIRFTAHGERSRKR
jgi:hypothetical protein